MIDGFSRIEKAFITISVLIMIYLFYVILSGFWGPKINSGDIVNKFYEPRRVTTEIRNIMIGNSLHPQPIPVVDDEDFVFIIEGSTKKEEKIRKRVEVTKQTYYSYEVGDHIILEKAI